MNLLRPLLGSVAGEQVLVFILARDQGYAREMARFFNTDLLSIQNQLKKYEIGGILVNRPAGRTQLYMFNPRYPFLKELKSLLEKAASFYPELSRDELFMNRRRPRRTGKPL